MIRCIVKLEMKMDEGSKDEKEEDEGRANET